MSNVEQNQALLSRLVELKKQIDPLLVEQSKLLYQLEYICAAAIAQFRALGARIDLVALSFIKNQLSITLRVDGDDLRTMVKNKIGQEFSPETKIEFKFVSFSDYSYEWGGA